MSNKALKMAKKAIKYVKKAQFRSNVLFITCSMFCSMSFPHQSMAIASNSGTGGALIGQLEEPSPKIQEYSILAIKQSDIMSLQAGSDSFPEAEVKKPVKRIIVSASAYNSEAAQTDASPCITANGFNVCEHGKEDIIATNMFPFGTKIVIPSLDPNKVYTVSDRMNARYQNHIDIWMLNKEDAIKFGRKTLEIEVY